MMSEKALIDAIFDIALAGNDADIAARRQVLWVVGITLLADVLGRADEFNRERLLRGLEKELRGALADIEQIRRTPYPVCQGPGVPEEPYGPLH
jgi:hypothetical protein